ncbi:hypothetical protein CPB83DRAFT_762997 [Crepidotus variabilis]|uniref:Uncharacterized protein n=1 Tax=Crepidotus variabilis TaxID=179855 RepID=A0A9P6EKL9_9AGAR|nr:hypothetical protein CPB83DRAFT_762997 [Crepidotus variabilis]
MDSRDNVILQLQDRIQHLEQELRDSKAALTTLQSTAIPTPSTHSPNHRESRTQARKQLLCSLNRAGNALCAWHNSQRERRAYPPRSAPPGFLTCGCTYEQALFEESLSRHGVGSQLPGDTVRMNPALRNPLLKLLEERYGYRDGDFEFDPVVQRWAEGEEPDVWEQRAKSGSIAK